MQNTKRDKFIQAFNFYIRRNKDTTLQKMLYFTKLVKSRGKES